MRLVLLALALFLALAPVVMADHVYSHRTYVLGRVLDVEGRPAAGVVVTAGFDGIETGGRCFDSRPEVTGPRGDYEICRHTHALREGISVTVSVGNTSRTVAVDPDLRLASVDLQLGVTATHDVSGERQFARGFDVRGRAFTLLPEPVEEEGVRVNARPSSRT